MDDSNVEMLCCVKICFGADFSQEVTIGTVIVIGGDLREQATVARSK